MTLNKKTHEFEKEQGGGYMGGLEEGKRRTKEVIIV